MKNQIQRNQLRDFWLDYRSEVVFGVVLCALVALSYWLGTYIPEDVFENVINPVQYVASALVCLGGAFLMFRHHNGILVRKSWGVALLVWGVLDVALFVIRFGLHVSAIGTMPANPLYNLSISIGNLLALLLFVYPTQVLHPGWLTWRRIFWLLLPVFILVLVDHYLEADLLPVMMIYPLLLFFVLCAHVRKYRVWCEDNFSSMDNIDAQWIVRYLTIMAILGVSFYFISFWYIPNRMFTQQWLLFFMLAYATEQILFRKDPWAEVKTDDALTSGSDGSLLPDSAGGLTSDSDSGLADSVRIFEQWMQNDKPYLNPDFQLTDLRQVLPTNRSYLSQLINTAYGCTFYQLVNRYRVEEAQRLMTEHPQMKMADIASACGFSSPAVFSRSFARETGMSPTEWSTRLCNT